MFYLWIAQTICYKKITTGNYILIVNFFWGKAVLFLQNGFLFLKTFFSGHLPASVHSFF